MTYKALLEANDNMASAISVMEADQAQQLADFREALNALEGKIDAIPVPGAADYTEITEAIAALNADLTIKIEAINPTVQEQN